MAITLTSGASTIPVSEIIGYRSSQESRNRIHTVIGRADPDVTLGYLGLRSGTMTFLCATLAEGFAKRAQLAIRGVQRLEDTEVTEASMYFVVTGTVDVLLDDTTSTAATVTFGFQEVLP